MIKTLDHGTKCFPSNDFMALSGKCSGRFLVRPELTSDIVSLLNGGGVIPNNTLRKWIHKHNPITNDVGISASDLYNFRFRVKLYGSVEGIRLKFYQVQKLWNCKSLDNEETSMFKKVNNVANICSEIVASLKNDSNSIRNVENY